MKNKELITILTGIESVVDVNNLTYEGYCAWPYIRNQLAIRLMHGSRQQFLPENPSIESYALRRVIEKSGKLCLILVQIIKNVPIRKKDLVFLTRTSERDELVEGAWYNPYGDSFCDLFADKFPLQLLEFYDYGPIKTPQSRPSIYLDLRFYFYLTMHRLKALIAPKKIEGFSELKDHLDSVDISWPDAERTISDRLLRIFAWKNALTGLLKKLSPKLFFITCCYCDKAMAAILACHDLDIPSVEFQHGAQNDNNPFLTNWTKVPEHGYEMLPYLFWNWGEESAERIRKWASNTTKHKAFVGGNLWMSKWIRDGFQTNDCDRYDIDQVFPANRKHLLISLQLWPDSLPDFLLEVLRDSPDDWFWHIRQHPRHKVPEKEIGDIIGKISDINYEFHDASDMPLYLLLKNIDLHLTGYSTVAFEAAQFSVPTIFYHPNARDGFKTSLDDNMFSYAEDDSQLFSLINKMLKREKNEFMGNNYININQEKHIECLESMIDFSKSKRR